MQIELRELSSIRPYENNPRNNEKAVDAVAASIKEYGFSTTVTLPSVVTFARPRFAPTSPCRR